jgi:hypothetical protein
MAENGLEHALKAIDPVARAMLDLSIRRRLPDSSIADLAQMPADELVRWRGEVLDQLATQIGLTGPTARDEVRKRLEAIDQAAWVAPASASPMPARPRRESPSRRLLWLLALLVVLVAVVAIISLSGDDSGGSPTPPPPPTSTTTKPTTSSTTTTTSSTTTTKPTSTTTTTTPTSPPVTMDPLPGMPDRGTASVTVSGSGDDRTITVELKGLAEPDGVYELWLYNTLIGAHPLGTASSGNATITARLPADAGDFRYLDLSRESGPNDRIHSGISVRRAALAPLLSSSG